MSLFGGLKKEHWNELLGVLLIILSIWMMVSLFGYGGSVGNRIRDFLSYWIGYIPYLFTIVVAYWGFRFFISAEKGILSGILGSICLLLSGLMLLGLLTAETWRTVGILGERLDTLCIRLIGVPGLFLAGFVFLILGFVLCSELTFSALFRGIYRGIRRLFGRPKEPEKKPAPTQKQEAVVTAEQKPVPPRRQPIIITNDLEKDSEGEVYLRRLSPTSSYIIPPLSLLDKPSSDNEGLAKDRLQETARILERSFQEFGIDAKVLRVNRGPVITRYEVEPGTGVKVNKFVGLTDDLALVLRAVRVRVVAPVPGEGVIGIEVPNEKILQVVLRDILESQEFRKTKSKLALPLGKEISGKPIVVDLVGMPHLLVAGTTGSGKSVFLNSVISSLLFTMTPDELRLLMIDPKRVELNAYDGVPHLMAPVVTDSMRAPAYLQWALREVDKRYKKLANLGVRNMESYNKHISENPDIIGTTLESGDLVHGKMPYIIIIIDELADLMMVAGNEVETTITRLAQIARAAGIHMIVSTQRPTVNVVTGSIKANFPCRLSFRLASKVDSRTILDMNGAENLLGKGDMLFLDTEAGKPVRIQGCYVSDSEVERIVDFIKQRTPVSEAEIDDVEIGVSEDDSEEEDDQEEDLYNQAVQLVMENRTASTSFLQRKLTINYDRALRVIERMEAEGIVGPDMGDQAREVLIHRRDS